MPKLKKTFYKCMKCNKIFDQKGHYDYHVYQRKRPCEINILTPDTSESGGEIPQIFKCIECNKAFTRKDNLTRHIKYFCKHQINESIKSNVLVKQNNNDNIQPELKQDIHNDKLTSIKNNTKSQLIDPIKNTKKDLRYKCNYCKKDFCRSDVLNKHLSGRCAVKKHIDVQKEAMYQKLLKQVEQQQEQINYLTKKMCNSPSTNQSNSSYNIQLLAFGQEDNSHITNTDYKSIINKGYNSVQELVKHIHFNIDKPENHNLYISNIRGNYVMIYNGTRWTLGNKKDTINQLYIDKRNLLVEKFDELVGELSENAIRKFNRFINEQQDDASIKSIKEEIKLILYNNKNIPETTKQKLGVLK